MLHHKIIGSGHPIVILHGVTLDHRYMLNALEPVFEENDNFQRIYVDLPGHGKSPAQDNIKSQDDLLNTVLDFIRALLSDKPFALIGLSRGSYLARGIVHLMPGNLTGVALILPGGNPSADPARLPKHTIIAPNPALRKELADHEIWAFDNLTVLQEKAIIERRRHIIPPAKKLFDTEQESRVFNAFDFSFQHEEETFVFDGPSVIIAGRQDSISGYRDAIDLLPKFPRASLAVLDCAGHGLAWERPEIFISLIRDWLDRVTNYQPIGRSSTNN